MTLNEFRAWLEGFEASFTGGVPNAEQWKVIKAKLTKVASLFPAPAAIPNLFPKPYVDWPLPQGPRYVGPSADYVDPNQTRVIS